VVVVAQRVGLKVERRARQWSRLAPTALRISRELTNRLPRLRLVSLRKFPRQLPLQRRRLVAVDVEAAAVEGVAVQLRQP
jgi:hypothetical protein